MTALEPSLAADIANGVYGIREIDNLPRAFQSRQVGGLEQHFDVGGSRILGGQSGGRVVNQESGFALVMPCTGRRAGQTVVAIRGTATAFDGITDLNGAATPGPTGFTVHAGFMRVYDSIEVALMAALRGSNPSTLHVVGHSLGGAIANLVAATLAAKRVAEVKLYTFGAPRTGFNGFSRALTQTVGADNIHRVYNISDVVPMVPLFPYIHAPSDVDGYRIRTTGSSLSLEAHYMSSYTPGVANHQWSSLATQSAGVESTLTVDHWLSMARQHVNIPGSSLAFFAIGKALGALLGFIRITLGLVLLGASTLLDQLAALLYRAATLSAEVLERLSELLRLALRFSGRPPVAGQTITTTFIIWVLGMLMRPIHAIGSAAVQHFAR